MSSVKKFMVWSYVVNKPIIFFIIKYSEVLVKLPSIRFQKSVWSMTRNFSGINVIETIFGNLSPAPG